jgi:hypothetical protein
MSERSVNRASPQRPLGLVPASLGGRLFWAWGLLTFVLTMLPVWDVVANDARLIGGILPLTILWSYAVFGVVNLLALAIYLKVGRDWADWVDRNPDLIKPHASMTRRQRVLADLAERGHRQADDQTGQEVAG